MEIFKISSLINKILFSISLICWIANFALSNASIDFSLSIFESLYCKNEIISNKIEIKVVSAFMLKILLYNLFWYLPQY